MAGAATTGGLAAWSRVAPVPDTPAAGREPMLPQGPTSVNLPVAGSATVPSLPEASPAARGAPLSNVRTVLIAGVDRVPGRSWGGLTDTLILVVISRRSQEVGLISIPRDLYVEIPHHGFDRINVAFGVAWQLGQPPLAALKQVVEHTLMLPVDHALVIDLNVFERLVDALGGVTVKVRCPIMDDFADPRTANGRRLLDVAAGDQHMDGATVAMYVRSRHGRSDFDRTERQQQVLAALHRELLDVGNLGHLPEVYRALTKSVVTDLKRYQLLDLARQAMTLEPSHVHALVLGSGLVHSHRTEDKRSVLVPDYAAIDRATAKLFLRPVPDRVHARLACPAKDVALRSCCRPKPPVQPSPNDSPEPLGLGETPSPLETGGPTVGQPAPSVGSALPKGSSELRRELPRFEGSKRVERRGYGIR